MALALPFAAAADEVEWAIEPADVFPGEDPGVLVIDASNGGRVAIGLPDQTMSFASRADFVAFMVQFYSAEPALDDQGEPYWYTLRQTVLGEPVYFDGVAWLDAEDPVALMVGGLTGQVEIGGAPVCVNPMICGVLQSGALALAAGSAAQPTGSSTNYGEACSPYHCGKTEVLSWNPSIYSGFQKILMKTWDLRWGRIVAYQCGYWPGYPPRPKYASSGWRSRTS